MQDLRYAWGEEVAKARVAAGLTQKALAQLCDVHPSTILRVETGGLNPNDELKWKIAGALGERMDVLWAWPRIVPPKPAEAVA